MMALKPCPFCGDEVYASNALYHCRADYDCPYQLDYSTNTATTYTEETK